MLCQILKLKDLKVKIRSIETAKYIKGPRIVCVYYLLVYLKKLKYD